MSQPSWIQTESTTTVRKGHDRVTDPQVLRKRINLANRGVNTIIASSIVIFTPVHEIYVWSLIASPFKFRITYAQLIFVIVEFLRLQI